MANLRYQHGPAAGKTYTENCQFKKKPPEGGLQLHTHNLQRYYRELVRQVLANFGAENACRNTPRYIDSKVLPLVSCT